VKDSITIGITDVQKQGNSLEIEVFPNPTTGIVFLRTTNAISAIVTLHDLSGRVVRNTFMEGVEKELFLDEKPGIYFLELRTNQKVFTKKVLISYF